MFTTSFAAPDRFLSTLPARGATGRGHIGVLVAVISIHAPREGSDPQPQIVLVLVHYFYPRSPRGERQRSNRYKGAQLKFLSTLPARGATPAQWDRSPTRRHFYPRSPRGERLKAFLLHVLSIHFYPRSPRGERLLRRPGVQLSLDFYPRSPRGERRCRYVFNHFLAQFLSTLPARGATPVQRPEA